MLQYDKDEMDDNVQYRRFWYQNSTADTDTEPRFQTWALINGDWLHHDTTDDDGLESPETRTI